MKKWFKRNRVKTMLSMTALLVVPVIAVITVATLNQPEYSYSGSGHPDGYYCDYGYKQATNSCCDEDDYSCEYCDKYGIYCEAEEVVQDFTDIAHLSEKKPQEDYDCSDFKSWETSQKIYIRDGGPEKDPYNLDRDGDKIACESLK